MCRKLANQPVRSLGHEAHVETIAPAEVARVCGGLCVGT